MKNRTWDELIQAWMDGELCNDCESYTFSCDRCYQLNEKDNQSEREK